MAFCHDFVWIILLYIAFPKYFIFCWFFLQKILCALEDPKICFWFKSSIRWFSVVHRSWEPKTSNYHVKIHVFLFYFHGALVRTQKMGTLVIVTHEDLCTNCSLNLLLFRCPKKVPKICKGPCGEFPSHQLHFANSVIFTPVPHF